MSEIYPALYRTARLFYPGGMEKRRLQKELERSQWLPREELEAQRLANLQKMVKHAYEDVPYYHNLFVEMDIHPEDIKTFEDFQALPFLTKDVIATHLGELVSKDFRQKLYMRTSGGSTGEPKRFFVDDAFWRWADVIEWRGSSWYGVREGDKAAWIWGARRDLPESNWVAGIKSNLKNRRFLNCNHLTPKKMQDFAEMLVRWKPAMFMAYPSAITIFAQYVRDSGIKGIHPRLIETTSEKVVGSQRRLLEEVFECPVANSYTTSELGQIAYQCEKGSLHVNEGCHVEIISNGQPVQPGQMGEMVVTSFNNYAMPFIRYKLDDMSVEESGVCSCGRELPVLREIVGRKSDFISTADGSRYSGDFVGILQVKPEIARYQAYQPDLDHLEVRIVCRQEVDSIWLENVRRELEDFFGARLQVSIRVVDSIELTRAGKLRRVISDVKTELIQ